VRTRDIKERFAKGEGKKDMRQKKRKGCQNGEKSSPSSN